MSCFSAFRNFGGFLFWLFGFGFQLIDLMCLVIIFFEFNLFEEHLVSWICKFVFYQIWDAIVS